MSGPISTAYQRPRLCARCERSIPFTVCGSLCSLCFVGWSCPLDLVYDGGSQYVHAGGANEECPCCDACPGATASSWATKDHNSIQYAGALCVCSPALASSKSPTLKSLCRYILVLQTTWSILSVRLLSSQKSWQGPLACISFLFSRLVIRGPPSARWSASTRRTINQACVEAGVGNAIRFHFA